MIQVLCELCIHCGFVVADFPSRYDEARFLAELILNMTSESLLTLPWSRIDAAPVNLWDESEQ